MLCFSAVEWESHVERRHLDHDGKLNQIVPDVLELRQLIGKCGISPSACNHLGDRIDMPVDRRAGRALIVEKALEIFAARFAGRKKRAMLTMQLPSIFLFNTKMDREFFDR